MGITYEKERQYFGVTQQVQIAKKKKKKKEPLNLSINDIVKANLRLIIHSFHENPMTFN